MEKNKKTLFKILLFALIGCQNKEIPPESYIKYWNSYKDELSDEKTLGTSTFRVTYLPTDLMVINDNQGIISKEMYVESTKSFCDYHYMTLEVSDLQNQASVKKYFIRDRQSKFSLISGIDSLPCILYHPEVIGIGSQIKVNLVFMRPKEQNCGNLLTEDLRIRYHNKQDSLPQVVTDFIIKKEKINQLKKIKI
jgi:hypothetical protein